MSLEALLAILTSVGLICLIWGVERAVRRDRTLLDKRLRRYGGRAYQLTDDEQKQAASVQVTQMLAKRVEASISGRTFAAALQTDLARANLKLTLGEFLILQVAAAPLVGVLAWLISGVIFVGSIFGAFGWFIPKIWLGMRQVGAPQGVQQSACRHDRADGQLAALGHEPGAVDGNDLARSRAADGGRVSARRARDRPGRRAAGSAAPPGSGASTATTWSCWSIAILVQFEIGGNLSRILDSIAGTIRERVKLNGEIRTMSAQGRMAGYVLSGMPVAIGGMLMLIAPSYMGALFTPGPWLVLPVAGLVGIVMGSLIIRKLVAIEV